MARGAEKFSSGGGDQGMFLRSRGLDGVDLDEPDGGIRKVERLVVHGFG